MPPKFISPARLPAGPAPNGGQAFFAYSANYLVDLDNAIVVDVEATTAVRQAEVTAANRMIERTQERFDLYPARLAGDSTYGSAEMLGWLVYEHGIVRQVRSQGRDILAGAAINTIQSLVVGQFEPTTQSSSHGGAYD